MRSLLELVTTGWFFATGIDDAGIGTSAKAQAANPINKSCFISSSLSCVCHRHMKTALCSRSGSLSEQLFESPRWEPVGRKRERSRALLFPRHKHAQAFAFKLAQLDSVAFGLQLVLQFNAITRE